MSSRASVYWALCLRHNGAAKSRATRDDARWLLMDDALPTHDDVVVVKEDEERVCWRPWRRRGEASRRLWRPLLYARE